MGVWLGIVYPRYKTTSPLPCWIGIKTYKYIYFLPVYGRVGGQNCPLRWTKLSTLGGQNCPHNNTSIILNILIMSQAKASD